MEGIKHIFLWEMIRWKRTHQISCRFCVCLEQAGYLSQAAAAAGYTAAANAAARAYGAAAAAQPAVAYAAVPAR